MARELDLGRQYPSTTPVTPDKVANRQVLNPFTGPEVVTAKAVALETEGTDDDIDFSEAQPQLMQVLAETGDALVCQPSNGVTTFGIPVVVAKPSDLQQSRFDGQTINGKEYTYIDHSEREVVDGDEEYTETINQLYLDVSVSLIVAARLVDGVTGVENANYMDLNISARRFERAAEPTDFDAIIKSVTADYLTCKELDADDAETGDTLYVMKPWLMRRSVFDGQTVNNVSYTYSSDTERVATPSGGDPEDQLVTQDYYIGAKIIVGTKKTESDAGGNATQYYDVNDSGRAWAVPLAED